MELTELRKRMEHDIDEVSNIAKNIKDQLEALDREVSYVCCFFFLRFFSPYIHIFVIQLLPSQWWL
jgi:hypothetical protein